METEYSRIAMEVKKYGEVRGILGLVNSQNLAEEHRKQLNNKAVGIDKVSKEEYAHNLTDNLSNLVARMKTFSYKPQPVKRVYIPKGNNGLRPLGIPAYEDKLVQGVMANILGEIYEPKFLECSYGFRPNKSCHLAIKELDKVIMTRRTLGG